MTKYTATVKSSEYAIIAELLEKVEEKSDYYNKSINEYVDNLNEKQNELLEQGYNLDEIETDWSYKNYKACLEEYKAKAEACKNILEKFNKF